MLICWYSETIPGSRTDPRIIIIAERESDCTASYPGLFGRDSSPAPEGWEEEVSQQAWESCRGSSLAGTIRALHASKRKCQLIEFANDTFSRNPSRCTHHFVLAIKLQAKGKKKKKSHVVSFDI